MFETTNQCLDFHLQKIHRIMIEADTPTPLGLGETWCFTRQSDGWFHLRGGPSD